MGGIPQRKNPPEAGFCGCPVDFELAAPDGFEPPNA
jgi:hypothetical protein